MQRIFSILLVHIILGWNICSAQNNLDSGLIARYAFDNTFLDSTSNNYHGTAYGNPVFVPDRFGNDNSACWFNGTTDYIRANIGYHPAIGVSVWIRTPYPIQNNYPSIFDYGTKAFSAQIDGYTGASFPYDYGKAAAIVNDTLFVFTQLMISDADWHHLYVDAGFPGYGPRVYLDGYYQNNYPWYVSLNIQSTVFCIARVDTSESLWANYWVGEIDELRIYNRYLSENEINRLYNPSFNLQKNQQKIVEIFPNPLHDILYIRTTHKDFRVELYNLQGQLLLNEKNCNSIQMQDFVAGVYLVSVEIEGKKQMLKIVKR